MNQHLDRLNFLAPMLYAPALRFIQLAQGKGITLTVVFTWRSVQEQSLIYQKGRTFDRAQGIWTVSNAAQVVTNAKPGVSAHNVVTRDGKPAAMALDVMPMKDGQIDWVTGFAFWQPLYALAWKCGLDPLGDQQGAFLAGDWGHLEEPCWRYKLDALQYVQPTTDLSVGV